MNDNYILDLVSAIDQSKSKKQVNADIKTLEKTLNMLRLTATLAQGSSKKEINAYIKNLSNQLSTIKLKAQIDSKNLKSEVDKALNNISFKDIDALNIDENKTKLKVQKVISNAKVYAEKNPISIGVNIDSKRSKLDNDLTTYLNRNTKISESSVLLNEANKVRDLISAITDKKSLREATDAFQLYKSEVSATGFATKSTADRIKDMLSHVTKLGSIFSISTLAFNNFTKSLGTLKDIDDILTEISKTSNMTAQELEKLGDISFKSASKYGKTASDYLLGIQEMSRSGFYGEKGTAMAEQSLLAQAAGDMSADVANKYILATNAAYKYNGEATKLNAVLDGQNSITNRNSVAMSDMAVAMSEAGTVASSYRVSIEDLSAMIGTMESVTKLGGSEVGNGIKAILINLQNVTSSKITDTLDAANASMTEFVNGTEKLRDPISILRDLAETFNQLDEDDALRAEILTNIGGKHQAAKLAALLQNMELFDKMLVDYSEGAGSSMEEAMKSANNLSGKLNQIQNSWDSLVNSVINKNSVLNGLTFGDKLIRGVESFIDTFGTIPTILTAINSSMVAMKKDYGLTKIWDKENKKIDLEGNVFGIDISKIKNLKKHYEDAALAISDWNCELANGKTNLDIFENACVKNSASLKEYLATCSKDAPASLNGYKQYLQQTGQATEDLRLKTILLNTALTFLGSIAVQAVITGITEAFDKFNETVEESQGKVDDINSKISDLKTQIEELNGLEYKSDFDNQKIQQLERELELQEKILEIEQKRLYQNQIGTKFSDYFDRDSLITKQQAEYDHNNKENFANLSRGYDTYKSSLNDIDAELDSLQEKLNSGDLIGHNRFVTEGRIAELTEKRNDLLEKQQTIEDQLIVNMGEYLKNYQTAQEAIESGLLTGSDLEKAESMAEYWNQLYQDSLGIVTNIQKMGGRYDNTNDLLEERFGNISRDDLVSLSDADKRIALSFDPNNVIGFEELQQKIAETKGDIVELNGTEVSTFEDAWADSFTSENETVKELGNTLLDLAEKGRLTKETFNEADSTAGGYFKNLGISADEAVSKINKLVDESSQLSSMSSQISSMAEALGTKLENGFVNADTLSGFNVEVRGLESWDRFQSVLGSTTSSYQECQEAANALATEWVNSSDFLAQLTEQNEEYYKTQLEAMGIENYEELISYAHDLNEAKEVLSQSSLELGNATYDESEALIAEGQYSELTANMILALYDAKIAEQAITLDTAADCQNLIDLAGDTDTTSKSIQLLIQLMEIYNNLESGTYDNNAIVRGMALAKTNAIKAQLEALANGEVKDMEIEPTVKLGSKGKSSAKSAGKKAGDAYKDGLKEALSDIEGVISGVTKAIDRQISSIRSQKEIAVASIDAQIDALNEQKSALEDQKKALEEERDARIEIIEQQKKQLELAIKAIDKQIKAKEKIIKGIQDEIDAMRDANEQRKLQNTLMKEQYELERLQHQRTILQYSAEKGMFYTQNTRDIRSQKDKVDDAKLEIEIANRQKQIDLIQKEIDLLEEKRDAINEQINLLDEQENEIKEYFDKQIKAIDKQIESIDKQVESIQKQREEIEKFYESLIENLEKSKSKYEELTEIVDRAELSAALKKLGIDEEALLNGSEEEFEKLKNAYMNIVFQLNEGNDEVLNSLRELSGYEGTAPSMLEDSNSKLDTMNTELGTANTKVGNVNSSLSETASTTDTVATNVSTVVDGLNQMPESGQVSGLSKEFDTLAESIGKVAEALGISEGETVGTLFQAMSDLNNVTLGGETEGIIGQFALLKQAIIDVIETVGSSESQTVSSLMSAIDQLNSITLDESIIAQFTNLKEAIDSVTAAISGGGGDSSENEGSGGGSKGGKGSEGKGKGSEGGGGNSLTGAIESMGETANEVIGEPDAEGDGTVIGEFGSMETAVNDVRDAIGGGDSEGGQGSGSEDEGNLISSIVDLGETTEETLGESGGDGVIGRFEELKKPIQEADEHVHGISEGLDSIDGKEVECTIKVHIETDGNFPAHAAGTLGNMNLESGEYTAQYGKAFAEGTGKYKGLPKDEKNALVSEYGQTEMTVLPNGDTIITDEPTMMDLPKDTVIFNEEQTKRIMDNKIDAKMVKKYPNGVIQYSDGTVIRPNGDVLIPVSQEEFIQSLREKSLIQSNRISADEIPPEMPLWERMEKCAEAMGRDVEDLLNPLNSIALDIRKETGAGRLLESINNVSSVVNNTRNVQQPVVNHINVTLPNVTNSTSAESLLRDLESLNTKKYQVDW